MRLRTAASSSPGRVGLGSVLFDHDRLPDSRDGDAIGDVGVVVLLEGVVDDQLGHRTLFVVHRLLSVRQEVQLRLLAAADLGQAVGQVVDADGFEARALFDRLVAVVEQVDQTLVASDRVDLTLEQFDLRLELGALGLQLDYFFYLIFFRK